MKPSHSPAANVEESAEAWLRRFPLLDVDEREEFMLWMLASGVNMVEFAVAHSFDKFLEESVVHESERLTDREVKEMVAAARAELKACQEDTGSEEQHKEFLPLSRDGMLDQAGEWLITLTRPTEAEFKAYNEWLVQSREHDRVMAVAREAWRHVPEDCRNRRLPSICWSRPYFSALRAMRFDDRARMLELCAERYPGGIGAFAQVVRGELAARFPKLF